MEKLIRIVAVVQVVMAVLVAIVLFHWVFGSASIADVAPATDGPLERRLLPLIVAMIDAEARHVGSETPDEEIEKSITQIEERKRRTIEVQKMQEERRIGEVVNWFDDLMDHRPESGRKAREILDAYVEERYQTFGAMEEIDPDYAASYRESLKQDLGRKLMTELPPAQGVTIMKRLFI